GNVEAVEAGDEEEEVGVLGRSIFVADVARSGHIVQTVLPEGYSFGAIHTLTHLVVLTVLVGGSGLQEMEIRSVHWIMGIVGIVHHPVLASFGRVDVASATVDEVAPLPCLAGKEEDTSYNCEKEPFDHSLL